LFYSIIFIKVFVVSSCTTPLDPNPSSDLEKIVNDPRLRGEYECDYNISCVLAYFLYIYFNV